MTGSAARLRLAVDASAWQPEPSELDFLLGLLPDAERQACQAFRREEDKKHAVISRLLQRHAASVSLGVPFHEVQFARTRGRKPFVSNAPPAVPSTGTTMCRTRCVVSDLLVGSGLQGAREGQHCGR